MIKPNFNDRFTKNSWKIRTQYSENNSFSSGRSVVSGTF